jgi:hypothetical protein
VFLGALLHSFSECNGVEILPSLHDAAVKVLNTYQSDVLGPVDVLMVWADPTCPLWYTHLRWFVIDWLQHNEEEAKKVAAASAAASATTTAATAQVDTSQESSALLSKITSVSHTTTTTPAPTSTQSSDSGLITTTALYTPPSASTSSTDAKSAPTPTTAKPVLVLP